MRIDYKVESSATLICRHCRIVLRFSKNKATKIISFPSGWDISPFQVTPPPSLPTSHYFSSLPAYLSQLVDALPSPGIAYGTFDFSCMRGGGLEIDVEFNTINIKCEFSRRICEGVWIKSFDHCSWQRYFQSWVDRGIVGVTFP